MMKYGLYWYYYLIPKENNKGLFSDYSRSTLLNKFLTCWDYYDEKNKKNIKLYHLFESYLDFVIFYFKVPDYLRSFYEIILGEFPQKIHFDIDIEDEKLDDEKILNDLINVIIELIPEIKAEKDICIYSSHGEKKKSYHLIINHYCHSNNEEAKFFYYTVMSKLPKEYFEKQLIDQSVYSKTQQFRTYGSMKTKTNRMKIFHNKWNLNGKKIEHIFDEKIENDGNEELKFLICFEESIVGARLSNCKILKSFKKPDMFNKKYKENEDEDIDYELAMESIKLLANSIGMTPEDEKFPFEFDKIESPFVILKRIKPSKCKICKRIHYHQNPYLFITPEKYVFYHCRRALAEKKMFIGSLEKETPEIFQKFEIIEGNLKEAEKDKKSEKTEKIQNEWNKKTLEKIEKLRKIAFESSPNERKEMKKKKEMKPEYVQQILENRIY